MSSAPFAREPDLQRLVQEGYRLSLDNNWLIVHHVPYVTATHTVAYGQLAYPVTYSGDRILPQCAHELWLVGDQPHSASGQPLILASTNPREIRPGLSANYMLSSKPMPEGVYPDQYAKVTEYVRILSHEALALDPTVTATPGPDWDGDAPQDDVFVYPDTATSRAALGRLNALFRGLKIGIVGLGGTGGYVLDQVAKTPVAQIRLIDGDRFENHNAFRAPGAARLATLQAHPFKVEYFAELYGHMRRAIQPHAEYLQSTNLNLLDGLDFVFLCSDDPHGKTAVITYLEGHQTGFIDVGMGIEEVDGRLTGLLRTTTSTPDHRDHVHLLDRIPQGAGGGEDYGRNIQIADLNALNALMAVIRWKRHLGFYAGDREGFCTYSIYTNEISNEDFA